LPPNAKAYFDIVCQVGFDIGARTNSIAPVSRGAFSINALIAIPEISVEAYPVRPGLTARRTFSFLDF